MKELTLPASNHRCSSIDFARITRPTYICHKAGTEHSFSVPGPPKPSLSLGTVSEIMKEQGNCRICKVIQVSLLTQIESPEPDAKCVLEYDQEFCHFSLPESPAGSHFHTMRAQVLYVPPHLSGAVGPVLPWQLQQADTKGSQVILQLQAAAQPNENRIVRGVPETDGFIDGIGGRRVDDVVDYSLLRSWISICETQHGNACCPTLRPDNPYPGPSTVIDCQDMCLGKNTPRNRYIALSYVWGTAKVFRHLKENSDSLYKPGSLRIPDIPATIQDAITLVRGLGERYLWVDSLCIVQDDFTTQAAEISRMDTIYATALFTIIAAHGDSASAGLPGIRKGSRVHLQQHITNPQGAILSTIDSGGTRTGISRSVWNTRAWTYQERVCSSRALVFMKDQVYWQCQCHRFQEETALEETSQTQLFNVSAAQTHLDQSLPTTALALFEYGRIYYKLLVGYCQRRLTFQSDKLNAFAGIAAALQRTQRDEFVWGLPASRFSWALAWVFNGQHKPHRSLTAVASGHGGEVRSIAIPSWSWAAWSGDVNPWLLVDMPDSGRPASALVFYEPLVAFEVCGNDGRWRGITERFEQPRENRPPTPLGPVFPVRPTESLGVQEDLAQIGRLRFWSEVVTLELRLEPSDDTTVRYYQTWYVGDGDEFRLWPRVYLSDVDVESGDSDATPSKPRDTVTLDFALIDAPPWGYLKTLAMETRDGVRYRVGMAEFYYHSNWLYIPNRRIELVIMG